MNQTTYWTLNLKVVRLDSKLTKQNFVEIGELLSFGTSIGSACVHRRLEVSDDELGVLEVKLDNPRKVDFLQELET